MKSILKRIFKSKSLKIKPIEVKEAMVSRVEEEDQLDIVEILDNINNCPYMRQVEIPISKEFDTLSDLLDKTHEQVSRVRIEQLNGIRLKVYKESQLDDYLAHLERGLDQEGIFRLTKQQDFAEKIADHMLNGEYINFGDHRPYDLATAFKIMTNRLCGGVLCPEHLERITTEGDILQWLNSLSGEQRMHILLMRRVTNMVLERKSENLMNTENMARMFTPNIFTAGSPMAELLLIKAATEATRLILTEPIDL